MVQIPTSNDANTPMVVAIVGVGRVETLERQTMLQGARSVASSGQIASDCACRRSAHLTI